MGAGFVRFRALKTGAKRRLAHIVVKRRPGGAVHEGLLLAGGHVLRCALGRTGMSVFKREGDGATPAQSAMRVCHGFYRADRTRRPQSVLAMRPISERDGWCDAPGHGAYNRPVRLPFGPSHERMQRDDPLYDIVVVLDWNVVSRGRNRGSAIFLHCARPGWPATAGCIALARRDLHWLLANLAPDARLTAVI